MSTRVSSSRSRIRASSRATGIATTAIIAVALVAATSHTTFAQQAPAQPGAATAQQKRDTTPKNGQLTLRNTTRDTLRVELRLGNVSDCTQNGPPVVQLVPPGREWLIATKRAICWRRQPTGGSTKEAWTPWRRVTLGARDRPKLTL